MFYHLILTDECNLCCTYCRGKAFEALASGETDVAIDESLPPDFSCDSGDLCRFLEKDVDPCITFYGGEPLMRMDLVRTIMDTAPVRRFMIQTNGTLLDQLGSDYVNRMETLLVSIDGPRELTDMHRGAGTFDRVIRNIGTIIAGGYKGELIARMTVTEGTDIREAVRFLAANRYHSFGSIHWQIDADFTGDSSMRKFSRWLSTRYIPGVRDLVGDWMEIMETEGRVPRWYPFLQTTLDLLQDRPSRLRCGCGHANYTIMTDGHIAPCPVMIGMKDAYIGHIGSSDPRNLPVVEMTGSCRRCDILGFCGGRCLYADIVRPWPPEEKAVICSSVRDLRDVLASALPGIRRLIDSGKIRMEDFSHTRYNGCEIIP
ncbi:MAG: TIGR04084 family radical SAM/SPASM domain-containing protein [Methanomicrobiales archaeon]|nr:TIGR04084 family radical SAM/SPASM domain-containing protein [Methanomicrobiales archaeon]